MKSEPKRSVPSQVILGLFVIALGVLFLLDNLDVIEFRRALAFWPVVFIAAGFVKLLDRSAPNSALFGWLLIGAGVLMTLNRLGYIAFNLRTAWPLLLIAIGGLVIYRAVTGPRMIASGLKPGDGSDDVINVTAMLGAVDRRITTPGFRGGNVTSMMGGCQLDLRGSSIQGEAVLNIFALMGGITLKVPPDWTVVLQGTPLMGGFEEKTIVPPDGSKRLVIKGCAIMGGVEVRN